LSFVVGKVKNGLKASKRGFGRINAQNPRFISIPGIRCRSALILLPIWNLKQDIPVAPRSVLGFTPEVDQEGYSSQTRGWQETSPVRRSSLHHQPKAPPLLPPAVHIPGRMVGSYFARAVWDWRSVGFTDRHRSHRMVSKWYFTVNFVGWGGFFVFGW